MLKIGSAWQKINEETGKYSLSIALNEEVLELYPPLKNFFINLYENKEKSQDNHPDYFLYISKKESN